MFKKLKKGSEVWIGDVMTKDGERTLNYEGIKVRMNKALNLMEALDSVIFLTSIK
jgi:hypothetical protein